ncbi:fructose-bisphosphate aldolase [Rhizoctonia solani AG-1 IA]|uniref:fructose-bisphosphate aldolase n=1 Tax=Thanatephorus cucumeris (strain AG1-IA) TaxID=983506 RepID=L8WYV5_THACA|nr:fructose-bisphosphate aldolase [Rhizoctonia solani AG-1 IA]
MRLTLSAITLSALSLVSGVFAAYPNPVKARTCEEFNLTNAPFSPGIAIRTSTDRTNWSYAGTVWAAGQATWTDKYTKTSNGNLWAPDCTYKNGQFYLYYSASSFGSRNSAIFFAKSSTGLPGSWSNQGLVISTTDSNDYNAIDPNLIIVSCPTRLTSSVPNSVQLGSSTGKPSSSTIYSIAKRTAGGGAVEAPIIVKNGSYYYLFTSWDKCCSSTSSTYNIRVGRSTSITGPYVDKSGVALTSGGVELNYSTLQVLKSLLRTAPLLGPADNTFTKTRMPGFSTTVRLVSGYSLIVRANAKCSQIITRAPDHCSESTCSISRAAGRKRADLGRRCDLMGSDHPFPRGYIIPLVHSQPSPESQKPPATGSASLSLLCLFRPLLVLPWVSSTLFRWVHIQMHGGLQSAHGVECMQAGVLTGDNVRKLFEYAREHNGLRPIRCTTGCGSDIKAPIILQASQGGSAYFAGKGLSNTNQEASIIGAIAAAHHIRTVAKAYGVPVVLHTDHCAHKLLPWFDGMLDADEAYFKEHGEPLFSSHMLDLSEEPKEENIATCVKYFTRMAKMNQWLEMEIGITGGEEDGVDNTGVDNAALYTQPEDIYDVYKALSDISPNFSIAAAFGNVHGVYKPGNVVLRPEILAKHQAYTAEKVGGSNKKPLFLVFHGGSGSTKEEIKTAVESGVVKMNVDTAWPLLTQWLVRTFSKPRKVTSKHRSATPRVQTSPTRRCASNAMGQVMKLTTLQVYDPRVWVREGEKTLSARVKEACKDLGNVSECITFISPRVFPTTEVKSSIKLWNFIEHDLSAICPNMYASLTTPRIARDAVTPRALVRDRACKPGWRRVVVYFLQLHPRSRFSYFSPF